VHPADDDDSLSAARLQLPATRDCACATMLAALCCAAVVAASAVKHDDAVITIKSNDGSLALTLEQSSSGLAALRMRSVSVNGTTTALGDRSGLSLGFGGETFPVSNGGSSMLHLAGGGVAFRRALTAGAHTASLMESLIPMGKDAIAWKLMINGTSAKLWSPSISAVLEAAGSGAVAGKKLWLPWSKPQNGCSRPPSAACDSVCNGYASPLEPVPTACLLRGGTVWGYGGGGSMVSVPLAAMLDTTSDTAFTLSVAPAPNLISVTNMQMKTTDKTVGVAFGPGYRVSSSSTGLSLTFHITASQACPWDVLARYSNRHAEYFEPPNRNVHYRASGMGSYAATQGSLTQIVDGAPLITTMKEVGYAVNWDATFWWPYIMQIAPTIAAPSNETVLWGSSFDKVTGFNNRLSTVHVKASYAIRDAYYAQWQKMNLTVLGYFNGWELGQQMTDYPPAAGSCPPTPDLWRSAPCFIHKYLDSALCTDARGHRNVGAGSAGWDGDTMLDPGTKLYRSFLKTQVQNHLDMEPHFMGLASDGIRACVNFDGDDGVSCLASGAAAESVCRPIQDGFTAWHTLMSEVSPMLTARDKIFSANTVNGPRIHEFRFADLFITEQSAHDYATNCVNSFLGIRKPGVMWTTSTSTTDCPSGDDCSDRFFQRLLHLGLFPMPPMPDGDHSLQNGSALNHAAFVRYGPLFKMLRGREWALRSHAVSVSVQNTAAELARLQMTERTAAERVRLSGNVATLTSCSASDGHQLWQNLTKPPYCIGKQPCGELASKGSPGSCLEVQNGAFSGSACGNGALSSNIWIYACTTDGPGQLDGRSRDCPQHENVQWRLTGNLLRSAVPAGPPPGPATIPWDTCLVTTTAAAPLSLAVCNASDPRQHWTATPVGNGSDLQLKQGEKCVSSVTSGPPPPPPSPPPAPVPTMRPVVNLFKDQFGAEIVVITSPGSAVNKTVAVTVRGSGFSTPKASVVRPGEAAPSVLPTVRMQGGDVVFMVELVRGAAVVKLTQ
jgi:hypothetical protein